LEISSTGFVGAGCPSCHPTNSVKVLKETQSTDPKLGNISYWPHPFFIHNQSLERRGVAAFTPAVGRQYPEYNTRQQVVKVRWHKATSRVHTDGFTVLFATLCQCTSTANQHPLRTSAPPSESLWVYRPQHMSRAGPFSPSKLLIHMRIWTPSDAWFLRPTHVQSTSQTALV